MPAHLRAMDTPVDFTDLFEDMFTSPAGHLLPHSGWNVPSSIRRSERAERCEACGRPPSGGVLVEISHRHVEGRLQACRLCSFKLNGGDPRLIARLERAESRRFRRVLELRDELRDKPRWTTVAPGRVRFAGSLGSIELHRIDYVTWHWSASEMDPLPGDAPETGVAPFGDAVEAAAWALLARTVYAWTIREQAENEQHAAMVEAADEIASHVEAEGLWQRGLH